MTLPDILPEKNKSLGEIYGCINAKVCVCDCATCPYVTGVNAPGDPITLEGPSGYRRDNLTKGMDVEALRKRAAQATPI